MRKYKKFEKLANVKFYYKKIISHNIDVKIQIQIFLFVEHSLAFLQGVLLVLKSSSTSFLCSEFRVDLRQPQIRVLGDWRRMQRSTPLATVPVTWYVWYCRQPGRISSEIKIRSMQKSPCHKKM